MDEITVIISMGDSAQDAEILRTTCSETVVRHPATDQAGATDLTLGVLDRLVNQAHDAMRDQLRDMGQVHGTMTSTGDTPDD